MFLVTFSLSCVLRECFTNAASAEIQPLYSPFTSSLIWPVRFQYFFTPVSPKSLATSMSELLIAYIYLLLRSIRLDIFATSACLITFPTTDCPFFSPAFSDIITSFIAIIFVWCTLYCRICTLYSLLLIPL